MSSNIIEQAQIAYDQIQVAYGRIQGYYNQYLIDVPEYLEPITVAIRTVASSALLLSVLAKAQHWFSLGGSILSPGTYKNIFCPAGFNWSSSITTGGILGVATCVDAVLGIAIRAGYRKWTSDLHITQWESHQPLSTEKTDNQQDKKIEIPSWLRLAQRVAALLITGAIFSAILGPNPLLYSCIIMDLTWFATQTFMEGWLSPSTHSGVQVASVALFTLPKEVYLAAFAAAVVSYIAYLAIEHGFFTHDYYVVENGKINKNKTVKLSSSMAKLTTIGLQRLRPETCEEAKVTERIERVIKKPNLEQKDYKAWFNYNLDNKWRIGDAFQFASDRVQWKEAEAIQNDLSSMAQEAIKEKYIDRAKELKKELQITEKSFKERTKICPEELLHQECRRARLIVVNQFLKDLGAADYKHVKSKWSQIDVKQALALYQTLMEHWKTLDPKVRTKDILKLQSHSLLWHHKKSIDAKYDPSATYWRTAHLGEEVILHSDQVKYTPIRSGASSLSYRAYKNEEIKRQNNGKAAAAIKNFVADATYQIFALMSGAGWASIMGDTGTISSIAAVLPSIPKLFPALQLFNYELGSQLGGEEKKDPTGLAKDKLPPAQIAKQRLGAWHYREFIKHLSRSRLALTKCHHPKLDRFNGKGQPYTEAELHQQSDSYWEHVLDIAKIQEFRLWEHSSKRLNELYLKSSKTEQEKEEEANLRAYVVSPQQGAELNSLSALSRELDMDFVEYNMDLITPIYAKSECGMQVKNNKGKWVSRIKHDVVQPDEIKNYRKEKLHKIEENPLPPIPFEPSQYIQRLSLQKRPIPLKSRFNLTGKARNQYWAASGNLSAP